MKLNEILAEAYDYRKLQQEIYAYVFKKMKLTGSLLDYAKELAKSSDQFWVQSFDDIDHEIYEIGRGNINFDSILDVLSTAITDLSNEVVSFFGDAANHPPGYKVQKLTPLEIDDLTSKELTKLINVIDPSILAKIEAERVERQKQAKAASKLARSRAVENFDAVVACVKKYDEKGWKEYTRVLNSGKNLSDYLPKNAKISAEEAKKLTVNDVKALFKDSSSYVITVLDNLWNLDGIDPSILADLGVIARDSTLSKKLYNLIK